MEFLLIFIVLIVSIIWLQSNKKAKPKARRKSPKDSISKQEHSTPSKLPASFPVQTKQYFFSRSEAQFYGVLLEALQGSPYMVFANVRLNDVFLIKATGSERQSVLGRLKDKHLDFLILEAANYKPVLGIELDGASHDTALQQYRDQVKDLLFASARFPLLRLNAAQKHTPQRLKEQLKKWLK